MGITASKRWGKTDKTSFWYIMMGAFFFIISDSLLAINQFTNLFSLAGFFIMLTYILAQFMIVKGIVVFVKGSDQVHNKKEFNFRKLNTEN